MALPEILAKKEVPVNIVLIDGTTLDGCFYANEGQRLLELMNDNRTFIPHSDIHGKVTIIQKTTIARIKPIYQNVIKKSSSSKAITPVPDKVTPAPPHAGTLHVEEVDQFPPNS